ncbi:anti-sigma factor [Streptomyces sp. E2N166]|uniref:anti-sigma factor n=1 Tax=Streptomyces sp. E2N166 TaxID=1851909 RepID=UPI000EF67652|nr:anti-sigma factor [Streptomyces sp. E2N166]
MSTNADLHTLTGAYALHALPDDERALFEEHLMACAACRDEVGEFTATAAKLAAAVSVHPPSAAKRRVLQRVASVRQVAPSSRPRSPSTGLRRRLPRLALAACLAAATALGGVAVWQHDRAEDATTQAEETRGQMDQLVAVLGAPDADTRTARLDDGSRATVVVSDSRDQAVLLTDLPATPSGKVYQAWYQVDGHMRSAGLMDTHRTSQALVLEGSANAASAVGITLEPTGGSARPTSDPIALLTLPA